jgi:GNAT superfamily N-acetyltransferase
MISLRSVGPDEAKVIREIAFQTWPDTFKEILTSEQISYMLNWMYAIDLLKHQMQTSHSFCVAEYDKKPIGFIGIELNHPAQGTAKIHKIYMLPSHQGKGIGKKLMHYSFEFAKQHGMSVILLNVNRFNKAVNFYEQLGFFIDREEVIDIGNGYVMDDYVMRCDLV